MSRSPEQLFHFQAIAVAMRAKTGEVRQREVVQLAALGFQACAVAGTGYRDACEAFFSTVMKDPKGAGRDLSKFVESVVPPDESLKATDEMYDAPRVYDWQVRKDLQ